MKKRLLKYAVMVGVFMGGMAMLVYFIGSICIVVIPIGLLLAATKY